MIIAVIVGCLFAGAIYLILQRGMIRIAFGFVLLTNAINLFLLSTGGTTNREQPFVSKSGIEGLADPLPQSFVLTAIVISFAITVFLLTLSSISPNDDTNHEHSVIEAAAIKKEEEK